MIDINKRLFDLRDEKYRDFTSSLMPTVGKASVIGVRIPEIRKLAKGLKSEDLSGFLNDLPHKYHEENLLHAALLENIKDYDACIKAVDRFLPYIDNWAVCDILSPKVFKKNKTALLKQIKVWILSDKTYTVRFGLKMIMTHFLDEDFKPQYLETAAKVPCKEYYLSMMKAWLFATALAKQYPFAVKYLEDKRFDIKTHNRTIQKAVESLRITDDKKAYLKTLKIK